MSTEAASHDVTHLMVVFAFQLAVIIIVARLVGHAFERWLKLPRVLGELSAGMMFGPYALGALPIPGWGPLFNETASGFPVSPELYAVATLASIVLLFQAGLETDLVAFLRYSFSGVIVGIGGVLGSFILGDLCAVWFGIGDSFMDPQALFLGAASTATSVGITARILSEKRKTDSPEGVTILAGAVVDDVLCILVLAIVVGLAKVEQVGGAVPWGHIGILATKTLLFWVGSLIISLLTAPIFSRVFKRLFDTPTMAMLCLGLALFMSGLTETAGLAMIIGAYVSGLAFSRTDLVELIQEELHGVYELTVPAFFCVMGMLVDFRAVEGAVLFGLVFTLIAVGAKVVGCALPAMLDRFNLVGALRIGVGMLPRGEVALVVASVGLSAGVLETQTFGVAVMMTAITTLLAPPVLNRLLDDRPGLKHPEAEAMVRQEVVHIPFPVPELAQMMSYRLVQAFRHEEFFVHRLAVEEDTYHVRKDDILITLRVENSDLRLYSAPRHATLTRLMLSEELLILQEMIEAWQELCDIETQQRDLLNHLFSEDAGD